MWIMTGRAYTCSNKEVRDKWTLEEGVTIQKSIKKKFVSCICSIHHKIYSVYSFKQEFYVKDISIHVPLFGNMVML